MMAGDFFSFILEHLKALCHRESDIVFGLGSSRKDSEPVFAAVARVCFI